MRRNRVKPTTATLIRHTLNEIDTIAVRIADLEYNRLHSLPAVEQLAVNESVQFDAYLQLITRKQVDNRLAKLNCSLNHSPEPAAFPTNPHRYVHNLSSLCLSDKIVEALSLGPKQRIRQLDLEVQFETMFGQLDGLTLPSQTNLEQFKITSVNAGYQYLSAKPNVRGMLTRGHIEARTFQQD
ncbi:hypothetical protein PHET_04743 [Paragonimus heterotremus]|uniref:Uncharacterized protein n=1 Tax=Paragonimus heterotremus TaxID=100268 RepID=A0A8J4SPY7_9TREM|nr:hypothetical protein PHET_04743 [Paragonimus heterotremus]